MYKNFIDEKIKLQKNKMLWPFTDEKLEQKFCRFT